MLVLLLEMTMVVTWFFPLRSSVVVLLRFVCFVAKEMATALPLSQQSKQWLRLSPIDGFVQPINFVPMADAYAPVVAEANGLRWCCRC